MSIAKCERAFSMLNGIKKHYDNYMVITHLESVMWMAIEGPTNDFEPIFVDAINL